MSNVTAAANGTAWRWIAGTGALIALAVAWYFLPLEEWITAFDRWIRGLGLWGGLAFAGAYVLATVLVMPAWPLTVLAGLAWGVSVGFPLVLVSATLGATLAFLVSRYLLREQVRDRAGRYRIFQAIDRAISARGWRVVGLLRLSPVVPFNLQNYLYGITGIRFMHYVAATFVGMMPGTLMYVYFGAAGMAAVGGERSGGGALKWSFFSAGLVATVAAAVMITRKAREELDRIIAEEQGSAP